MGMDKTELMKALRWLIDDLLSLEIKLLAESGQDHGAEVKARSDRVRRLGEMDLPALARALDARKGDDYPSDLVRVLKAYWQKKEIKLQGRELAAIAQIRAEVAEEDDGLDPAWSRAIDGWLEQEWRKERNSSDVASQLVDAAWLVVLGHWTPKHACAFARQLGAFPRVGDVEKAIQTRKNRSRELRVKRAYNALSVGIARAWRQEGRDDKGRGPLGEMIQSFDVDAANEWARQWDKVMNTDIASSVHVSAVAGNLGSRCPTPDALPEKVSTRRRSSKKK